MIYFTGDIHAYNNIEKLSDTNFPEQKELTKSDYVVICGDFGCVWDGGNQDRYWQNWLEDRSFTTLFVDGNHENFDLLNDYSVNEWNGGKVHFIRPHVIHLMRGQIYNIDGKKIFTMGGAACHDLWNGVLNVDDPEFAVKLDYMKKRNMFFRVNHYSWWKEELPLQSEMETGYQNLERHGFAVDYVVTHCLADKFHLSFDKGGYTSDNLTEFFTMLDEKITYKQWFCGHYHTNQIMDDRHTVLYEAVISESQWNSANIAKRKQMLNQFSERGL
ncbi:MAG: metallophosphoesterase [Anaerotignum sp.]|nr:metallophosphoesterase [Anaerotignum sp.]